MAPTGGLLATHSPARVATAHIQLQLITIFVRKRPPGLLWAGSLPFRGTLASVAHRLCPGTSRFQVGPKCVFILQESVSPYTICPVLIRERLHGLLLWWAELDLNQQNAETQQIYSLHRYQLRDTDPYYLIHSKGSSLILFISFPPYGPIL